MCAHICRHQRRLLGLRRFRGSCVDHVMVKRKGIHTSCEWDLSAIKCMLVEGLGEACLMSLLCEARRFSNHYGIVNNNIIIIVFVAACSRDIYEFSLLYTRLIFLLLL